jgi:WD40 repeat protein
LIHLDSKLSSWGKYIAVGDVARHVTLFDADAGDRLAVCTGHTNIVRNVAIDVGEGLVFSGAYDGAVRVGFVY